MNELLIYRPTPAAVSNNARLGRPPLPREFHVHPSGVTFACYDREQVRFPTTYDAFSTHQLGRADLEQIH
jgi:hypothetical protein